MHDASPPCPDTLPVPAPPSAEEVIRARYELAIEAFIASASYPCAERTTALVRAFELRDVARELGIELPYTRELFRVQR